jgi:protein TonB
VEIKDEAEIKEEIKVTFDMEITDQTVMEEIKYVEPPKIEEEVSEEIFLVVEQPAAPREGLPAFYKYLATKIRYPALANRLRVEGKVFVEFVVDKDGTLGTFNVVKGIGAGCDEEAVRVLREAPPWAPGKQRGKPVKQRLVLPIHFVMASS